MANTISSFTAGDLVISVYGAGDGNDTTSYGDNQASPITLDELSLNGTASASLVGQLVLPQTSNGANSAISGEYGSSSEGTLQLSGDGQSLTIAGYGIDAPTFNNAEKGFTKSTGPYGSNALAQTTSVKGGTATAVARVIADIRFDGTVDTSTAVYNVDNTNNPRSAVTMDGKSFYLAGQGVKGDTTQGLFYVKDGASSGTATDNRTVELHDGSVYVSTDSKQGPTSNIAMYDGEPTGAAKPTVLPGLSQNVTLGAGQGNTINNSSGTVFLSPENFFFANATTLYVADGGLPKQSGTGSVGDGGLQKWSLVDGTWKLDYTLSAGLNLVNGTTATAGTTGLIGLTGKVSGDTVSLFATNSTIGDTDPTYLYGIDDSLSATTNGGQSFTTLMTAAPDTNIRGVAFAPQATCFTTGTLIATTRGEVAVEHLVVGDRAVTASGAARPIRWIGHRFIAREAMAFDLWPVRIAAGAFGGGLPVRDLLLSPGHPVLVGADADGDAGHLVPVMCLVNGTTVRRVAVDAVTYWHVELDTHDVLLAEGLAAESYLDWGDRAFFEDGADHRLASPDLVAPGLAGRCRPVAIDGPVVEAERRRLDTVFATSLASACAWPEAALDV